MTGPLTVLNFNPSGVIYTNSSESTEDWPDIELVATTTYPGINEVYDQDRFYIVPILLRPSSFGQIQLSSNNPNDMPKADPMYLKNSSDIKRLVDGKKTKDKIVLYCALTLKHRIKKGTK